MPDRLWDLAREVIPPPPGRPQGGGRRRVEDRAVLAGIVFVATTGCSWRQLPPCFVASWQTVHRRFTEWSTAGVWARLHRAVLDELGASGAIEWSRVVVDSVSLRAQRGEN